MTVEQQAAAWLTPLDEPERTCATCGTPIVEARRTRRKFCSDHCRKAQYAGTCVDCGTPTNGSDGKRPEPRCNPCAARLAGAEKKVWTRERIVAAIRWWARKYGEPPAVKDWGAIVASDPERIARYRRHLTAGEVPSFDTAIRAFGSWNAAIVAAGFTPRAAHGGDGNQQRKRAVRAQVAKWR